MSGIKFLSSTELRGPLLPGCEDVPAHVFFLLSRIMAHLSLRLTELARLTVAEDKKQRFVVILVVCTEKVAHIHTHTWAWTCTHNDTHTLSLALSLWSAVAEWRQQRSRLLCVAAAGMGAALSLLHVYFKGGEPPAVSQCRDTAWPTSSSPSTQHLGTDGFAEIMQQMSNVTLLFPFHCFFGQTVQLSSFPRLAHRITPKFVFVQHSGVVRI